MGLADGRRLAATVFTDDELLADAAHDATHQPIAERIHV